MKKVIVKKKIAFKIQASPDTIRLIKLMKTIDEANAILDEQILNRYCRKIDREMRRGK